MKIVLWIGNESNQKALANKIHASFPISGIVTESKKTKSKITFSKLAEKVVENIFLPSIAKAWWGMKSYYDKKYANYPPAKLLDVENINSLAALDFTKKISPDLIIVSGTSLIRNKMLSLKPNIGIINLHTGLSPYIKGGPNCTNWCIATGQFHLIGNTIMFIDEGIDSGNIITTELTGFTGTENLLDVHMKVMEHAHMLFLKAIAYLHKNKNIYNVRQDDIAAGKTYYSKQWGLKQKVNLIKNFKSFEASINSENTKILQETVKTINIQN